MSLEKQMQNEIEIIEKEFERGIISRSEANELIDEVEREARAIRRGKR